MGKPEVMWNNAPDAPELGDDETPAAKLRREQEDRENAASFTEELGNAAADARKDRLDAASFTEELEKTPSERMHEKLDADAFTQALEIASMASRDEVDKLVRTLDAKIDEMEKYHGGKDDDSAFGAEVKKDIARLTSLLEAATERRRKLVETMPVQDDEIEII